MMKQRDIRFIFLVGFNLIAIAVYLAASISNDTAYTGWRRIDYQALLEKINNSELVRHEALFWHGEKQRNPDR